MATPYKHDGNTPSATAFPLIVFETEQEIRRQFPGDSTAEAAIALLREKCEAVTGRKFADVPDIEPSIPSAIGGAV